MFLKCCRLAKLVRQHGFADSKEWLENWEMQWQVSSAAIMNVPPIATTDAHDFVCAALLLQATLDTCDKRGNCMIFP
jgi:hypothetical protein